MADSRSVNSKRNIVSGLVAQVVNILLPFINRTVILYILGAEYQGLSTLFTSILSVLSLAELGLSSSIVFSMYKPIAEGDEKMVSALLLYFKRAYFAIGCVISGVGVALLPVLPLLINGSAPGDINIYVLYLMYLGNSVISYFFFAWKDTLLQAHQRSDIVTTLNTLTVVGEWAVKIVILFVYRNYYLYVLVAPFFTLGRNILSALIVNRLYPQYAHPREKLDGEHRQALRSQVGGLLIGRLADTARNSFDSIIISSLFGLTLVAIYGNYYYIFNGIYGLLLTITNALGASVGNSIVSESTEKNHGDLRRLTFLFAWISGWCTACLFSLYQPFMELWAGKEMQLPFLEMGAFCLYFYLINMNNTRNLYVNGTGIWWKMKGSFLLEAAGNLALNVVLGYFLGVMGVLLATILTIFVFNFLQRNGILFRNYFAGFSLGAFLRDHLGYFLVVMAGCAVCYGAASLVRVSGIPGFLLKGMICAAVPNLVFLLLTFRTKIFRESISWLLGVLRSR